MGKSVDPINEANVFLAYGRHAQAAEVLESAIKEDPTREDLKLKLTEIKNTPRSNFGLSEKQRIIIFTSLIIATLLKFLDYETWFQEAGSSIGFCALFYMAVCFVRRRRT